MSRFIEKNFCRCSVLVLETIAHLLSIVGLGKYYRYFTAALIRQSGLFDDAYYLKNNPDVEKDGYDPLRHYVAYGDRENRLPMPLFDPAYYRRNAIQNRPGNVNTLLHYRLVGRFRGIPTSPWFDTAYYLSTNRDVKFKGVDPLSHYLKYGGREGRSPCATFDGANYLLSHPDVARAGVNPLFHHLGCTQVKQESTSELPVVKICRDHSGEPPSAFQWKVLSPLRIHGRPLVDIIVPVYKGRTETLRCIFNVLRFVQKTPFALVVINDASPDRRLAAELADLSRTHGFTCIENKTNMGYVRSVNMGMKLHPKRDVVLLNADTQPCNDWLDRLRTAADRDPRIATVTPLSNNATICSYPVFDSDNPCPIEISSAHLDHIARNANPGVSIETPTAVGFCMYIKRACLDDIGLFDESAFSRGYGEENDFCQRAIRSRWKHVIATDVFVWHWGARSFKGQKGRRIRKALKILKRRYPNYMSDVAAFVAKDPLLPARRRMDEARLSQQIEKQNVLVITHNRGGGTQRSIIENGQRLQDKGMGLFFLTPSGGRHQARLSSVHACLLPNLPPVDFRKPSSFFYVLKRFQITHIHVHQLVDLGDAAPRVIAACADQAGVQLDVFVHDYQSICPRINMVDSTGVYCKSPAENMCNACLKKKTPDVFFRRRVDILTWRNGYGRLFEAASAVNVPNEDVKDRLNHWFPTVPIHVRPPEPPILLPRTKLHRSIRPGTSIRIVVVGAIVPIKGFYVLKACAKDAFRRHLPIEYVVMGFTKDDASLKRVGVTITGRYMDHEGVQTLQSLSPDLVWLPSIWPETYSYTLSLALSAGADIAAFDLGAIPRRLRAAGKGEFLQPLDWIRRPFRINDEFVTIRSRRIRENLVRLSFFNSSGNDHEARAYAKGVGM